MMGDMVENGRKVYYIHGGTEVENREEVRKLVETENNSIIIASYGTFSTGINIKKLHNIIFSSPSKSRIRVLQSIGRQLRKAKSKDMAKLYDIGDNICWKKYENHTFRHFKERLDIYDKENFDYRVIKIKLKEE